MRIVHFLLTAMLLCAGIVHSTAVDSSAAPAEPRRESTNQELHVTSPDGRVKLVFGIGARGECIYQVEYAGQAVLQPCDLGFAEAADLQVKVTDTGRSSRDERWRPVAGERAEVRDHYNALTVKLDPSGMQIEFRAYNEGIAFRYRFATAQALTNELTEFRFDGNYPCWPVYSAQGVYVRQPLSELRPGCERPLIVELPNGRWAAVGEAALVDFPRMRLQPSTNTNGVRAHLASPGTVPAGGATPWRFVLLADSAAQLLERNDLVLNLNEPCAIADTSWIKPGTVIREVTLTTDGGKACVDFAARMGIDYVEFDAGWYGHEYSDASDARAVNLDPKRSKGPLDLQEVIDYGKAKGVGVILYVNRRALERQLDEILPLYEKWGVKGVKYGFVNVGSQQWTTWLHEAVRKAAAHHLVVDIHDEYRPTGVSRTWPNLLTQEGVRGNEEMPSAEHNVILPFTRYLSGAADYTVCWNDKRLKTTRAHQLAAAVVFFSPLQFLFWYDRPASIAEEPALEFWRNLPTVWDDTRVLEGEPGKHVTIARRSGQTWYLGSMAGADARELDLPLDFLDVAKAYEVLMCSDVSEGMPRGVKVEIKAVSRGQRLQAAVQANGGYAARFTPR